VKKNQPGHEEETFEEFTARYTSFPPLEDSYSQALGWIEGFPTRIYERAVGITRVIPMEADAGFA
jgi:hypothetical protein